MTPAKALLFCFLLLARGAVNGQSISYPDAPQKPYVDTLYGIPVKDPYRWLEDGKSDATQKWAYDADSISQKYLDALKVKFTIRNELRELAHFTTDNPWMTGDYYFRLIRTDDFETASLFIRTSLHTGYDMLVDTRYFPEEGKIDIRTWTVSKGSEFLAFAYGRDGSEEMELEVVTLPDGKRFKDHLTGLKQSVVAWKDSGFYYSSQNPLTGKANIRYHLLNTAQESDVTVLEKTGTANYRYTVNSTSDERFLIIYEYNLEALTHTVYYKDLSEKESFIKPLTVKTDKFIEVLDNVGDNLICLTEFPDCYNRAVVSINPNDPLHWSTMVPHMPELRIEEAVVLNDKIALLLQDTFVERIAFFSFDGKLLRAQQIPYGMSCTGIQGNRNSDFILYGQETYCLPATSYLINTKTFEKELMARSSIRYEYDDFVIEQGLVKSKDGVSVPVFILYDKNHKPSPNSPLLLHAYGGFDVNPRPHYSLDVVFFVKHGGVYVSANIRGGGYVGSNWHDAGKRLNKQKSYDDVIAVAEKLIQMGYTSPGKLALKGGSNGGLMVGAVVTQRPELFKAAIAEMGLFDMIRYELYSKGNWINEYGTVKDSLDFKNLLSFSPYHQVNDSLTYPAMLITTAENDRRVHPMHSFKFAARLQSVAANKNPVLLQIMRNSGHKGALSWSDFEDYESGILAFLFHHLKMKW